jgi:hypothetical protein
MVAGGAIDSSIESQGSKPAAGRVGLRKHGKKNSGRLSRFAASFRLPEWEIGIHRMMRGEAEFYGAVANSATRARQVASALDLIDYWNAGSPSFRRNEFAVDQAVKNNLIGPAAARVMSSLNVVIYDAMVATWDSKYLYRRPQPNDLSRSLTTAIPKFDGFFA